jgi:hypothetical protein
MVQISDELGIDYSQVLSEHRSITSYLQRFHPDEDGPFGITTQCLETFIKSCAGYSVITYIMGTGDRLVFLNCLLVLTSEYLYNSNVAQLKLIYRGCVSVHCTN